MEPGPAVRHHEYRLRINTISCGLEAQLRVNSQILWLFTDFIAFPDSWLFSLPSFPACSLDAQLQDLEQRSMAARTGDARTFGMSHINKRNMKVRAKLASDLGSERSQAVSCLFELSSMLKYQTL